MHFENQNQKMQSRIYPLAYNSKNINIQPAINVGANIDLRMKRMKI